MMKDGGEFGLIVESVFCHIVNEVEVDVSYE
jgi:hypothetical protein